MAEALTALIGALASLIAGGLVSSDLIRRLVHRLLGKPEPEKTYSQRLSELMHSLGQASAEVDTLLGELAQVAKEKEGSVRKLEEGLSALEAKEHELQTRIKTLESVPIPAAEHFARLVETGEKRSAMRDYILFGAGVVVTTMITIAIQAFS